MVYDLARVGESLQDHPDMILRYLSKTDGSLTTTLSMLARHVDKRLDDCYISLLRSEARHFQDYLTLAKEIAGPEHNDKVDSRIAYFTEVEAALITSPDNKFKFHNGPPEINITSS